MSKYEPLGQYLRSQGAAEIPMTFKQIEQVIKRPLPHSKYNRAWWSNNPENNVMTRVWLDAGYLTEKVDIKGSKVIFRRIGTGPQSSEGERKRAEKWYSAPKHQSLIGWMKGTVTIAPGVDLTEPADPEWGKRVWGDQK
jgi:hypothetical protein